MMKRRILYFLFVLLSTQAFSQLGAGYLGKRFVMGYGFHFSPALFGSNGSGESIIGRGNAVGGDLAFNSVHDGFLEFAFKSRTSIGLSVKYYKTTFDNFTSAYTYTNYANSVYSLDGSPTGFTNISGLNYALYFKFYHRRYVAPWGRYFLIGPSINTFKCTYDPATMRMVGYDYSIGGSYYVNDFGPQGQQFVRADLLFGWGRSRIIANRITFDYGINFQFIGLCYTVWDAFGESPFDGFGTETITNLNYIEKTSKRRVREVNKLNIFLKVGILLF